MTVVVLCRHAVTPSRARVQDATPDTPCFHSGKPRHREPEQLKRQHPAIRQVGRRGSICLFAVVAAGREVRSERGYEMNSRGNSPAPAFSL